MIALRMLTTDCEVLIGRPYLARIDEDEYRVVYPTNGILPKNSIVRYKECDYYCDTGETFTWQSLRELAEIY